MIKLVFLKVEEGEEVEVTANKENLAEVITENLTDKTVMVSISEEE